LFSARTHYPRISWTRRRKSIIASICSSDGTAVKDDQT
jgi:hypothetical protein